MKDDSLGPESAKSLLGKKLVKREQDGSFIECRIVETEYYCQEDEASHSFRGRTDRNAVMYGEAGRLYVYFTYGMHYCMNVVVGEEGYGAAVLIRAVEPLSGHDIMSKRRSKLPESVLLSNGPAKLCQSLGVDRALNDHNLNNWPLKLVHEKDLAEADIRSSSRIGITKAIEKKWRFYIAGNPYVSY